MQATVIRTFVNAGVSAPPCWCQAGKEKIVAYTGRPPAGGGPVCMLYLIAGDGRDIVAPFDLRTHLPDLKDGALASPFLSDFDGTLKAFISYIPFSSDSDRQLAVLSTGIVPETTTAWLRGPDDS